ncbi:Conserved oligomeric Golgi complex [Babesia bigemina]|uniref:Conserved oligomeric Golgi complex n=1 Tax=Babesia bigemina TaxID=5866 RepID=A0A061D5S6_BABBI|nr:Conserved oligomeric Golgi complex [Babesia bigemina]CDR96071.1 Conserved oligomeric Golgi complex [Babesia bigemina]|eukprot:XP_012768257.1 Conserved oligomeric Golgi complex [Babesia bigemina]
MTDLLKSLVSRLERQEEAILAELRDMEAPTMSSLDGCKEALRTSEIAQKAFSLNDNFERTERFSERLLTAADTSSLALAKLECSLKVVDSVSQLYELGSRVLSSYESGDTKRGGEDISRFVAVMEEAKRDGHWDELLKVISCGHVKEVMSGLRAFVIEQLRAERPSEHSQLFTRLAVTLQAGSEAYESYLKTIREKTIGIGSASHEGSDRVKLERLVKNASSLLLGKAQAVHSELGSADYIRICREIHSLTSTEACEILRSFLLSDFAHFIKDPEGDIDSLLSQVESGFGDGNLFGAFLVDLKTVDHVLDNIATLSSLWLDYEFSFRSVLGPVYQTLLIQGDLQSEFGNDCLGSVSAATRAMQSVLSFYVRLEHASVTRALMHAINCDSIYVSSPEDGFTVATSTLVDDSFFVLQKAQQRAVATGDVQAACATLNQVIGIIQSSLKEGLVGNLLASQNIYKVFIENADNLVNGSWYVMLQEHFERCKQPFPESVPSRFSFIHCVNNIEECVNFLGKFKFEISASFEREFVQLDNSKLLVESTLESLDGVLGEFDELLELACKCSLNIIKFHIADPLNRFNDINFNLDEESYTTYLSENPFVEEFIVVLRGVFGHLSTFYSPTTRSRCMDMLIERICKFMEQNVLAKRFTMYGAVYLDGVVRSLMKLCTSYDPQIRHQFTSLLLISDVLNCGSLEELVQFEGQQQSEYVERYFALRTDIPSETPDPQ